MLPRILKCFFIPMLILALYGKLYTEQVFSEETVLVNSITVKTYAGSVSAEAVSFKEAADWAYNSGLTLLPDAPPFKDNSAFFLSQQQTLIPVSGYQRQKLQKIYIDFLRYEEPGIPFNAMIKISARDIYGNSRVIGNAGVHAMRKGSAFEMSVPFDLSYPGSFYIIIDDYSEKTGYWGIWDIIVSSEDISGIREIKSDPIKKTIEIEPKILK